MDKKNLDIADVTEGLEKFDGTERERLHSRHHQSCGYTDDVLSTPELLNCDLDLHWPRGNTDDLAE